MKYWVLFNEECMYPLKEEFDFTEPPVCAVQLDIARAKRQLRSLYNFLIRGQRNLVVVNQNYGMVIFNLTLID